MKQLGPPPGFTQRRHPPVLLLAGFPPENVDVDPARTLEIEEAVLSFARAALAQGRQIAVPADRVIAPLLSQVAGEYGGAAMTEVGDDVPGLVRAVLTGGRDPRLERMLAEGGHVEIGRHAEGKVEVSGSRHRLTPDAIERVNPERAVVIGEPPALVEEVELVRKFEIGITTIGPTLSAEDVERGGLWEHDAVIPMLREIGWERDEDDEDAQRLPYPFLMQELVWGWGNEELGARR